ncbi:MAG: cell wall anchor protein, partial [Microbacteriaceae bacterium]|nr:cell wall anchor protein [Microbacteriaceae bacterium]
MHVRITPPRLVMSATVLVLAFAGLVVLPAPAGASAPGPIAITEWEYNGSEFAEFTNISPASVDLAGWSFSDSAAHAGDVALGSLGTVRPGESFVVSEAAAAAFRTEWNLPDSVKVLGGNPNNLGRSDAINIYDSTNVLIDTLAYNDQGTGTVKGPRTDTASAWPSASADLFANTASAWTKSTVSDAEASWTSVGGFVGSPGISSFGTGVAWVHVNEVESAADEVELANLAPVAVDVSTWKQTDSGHSPGALSALSASSIPAKGYVTFTSNQGLSSNGDSVRIYLADGTTLLETVTYASGEAEPGSWSSCPDGSGASFVHAVTATFGSANDCTGTGGGGGETPATDPNWADISINEISSDNDGIGYAPLPTLGDAVELYNKGTHDVSLDGWKQIDSGAASAAADFSGALYVNGTLATVIPAGGYGVFQSTKGLSSGGDGVKIYTPDATLVDELTYT